MQVKINLSIIALAMSVSALPLGGPYSIEGTASGMLGSCGVASLNPAHAPDAALGLGGALGGTLAGSAGGHSVAGSAAASAAGSISGIGSHLGSPDLNLPNFDGGDVISGPSAVVGGTVSGVAGSSGLALGSLDGSLPLSGQIPSPNLDGSLPDLHGSLPNLGGLQGSVPSSGLEGSLPFVNGGLGGIEGTIPSGSLPVIGGLSGAGLGSSPLSGHDIPGIPSLNPGQVGTPSLGGLPAGEGSLPIDGGLGSIGGNLGGASLPTGAISSLPLDGGVVALPTGSASLPLHHGLGGGLNGVGDGLSLPTGSASIPSISIPNGALQGGLPTGSLPLEGGLDGLGNAGSLGSGIDLPSHSIPSISIPTPTGSLNLPTQSLGGGLGGLNGVGNSLSLPSSSVTIPSVLPGTLAPVTPTIPALGLPTDGVDGLVSSISTASLPALSTSAPGLTIPTVSTPSSAPHHTPASSHGKGNGKGKGSAQCCSTVQSGHQAKKTLALFGLNDAFGSIGLGCQQIPINVIGVAAAAQNQCKDTAVTCTGAEANGLIQTHCTPLSVN